MVSQGGNKKYFMKEMLLYKSSKKLQKLPHLSIKIIIVCIQLDRYMHTYINVYENNTLEMHEYKYFQLITGPSGLCGLLAG